MHPSLFYTGFYYFFLQNDLTIITKKSMNVIYRKYRKQELKNAQMYSEYLISSISTGGREYMATV